MIFILCLSRSVNIKKPNTIVLMTLLQKQSDTWVGQKSTNTFLVKPPVSNSFYMLMLMQDFTNNLKRDPLEIQHPTFKNIRLGFIESVHER